VDSKRQKVRDPGFYDAGDTHSNDSRPCPGTWHKIFLIGIDARGT